eukprot:799214-Pleurochrysis_carterae.AAC.1
MRILRFRWFFCFGGSLEIVPPREQRANRGQNTSTNKIRTLKSGAQSSDSQSYKSRKAHSDAIVLV